MDTFKCKDPVPNFATNYYLLYTLIGSQNVAQFLPLTVRYFKFLPLTHTFKIHGFRIMTLTNVPS